MIDWLSLKDTRKFEPPQPPSCLANAIDFNFVLIIRSSCSHKTKTQVTNEFSNDDRRRARRWFASSWLVFSNNSEFVRSSFDEVWHHEVRLWDLHTNVTRRPRIVGAGLALDDVVRYWTATIIPWRWPGQVDWVAGHCCNNRLAWRPWLVYNKNIF